MGKIKVAITGVGGYVPDGILSNKDLESMVDTNDEWIVSRTGIKERRILREKNAGVSYMGVRAVRQLLEKTSTQPKEIDLIIFATITPDMPFPATANILGHEIGANNAFGFDINAACAGFVYALTTGAQYISSGMCKKVVVIGGDKMSSIIDYQDRSTCIIFGDGVGCVMLEPEKNGTLGIIDAVHQSNGEGVRYLHMKAGGSCKPASEASVAAREHYVYQEGSVVFKVAVQSMLQSTLKVMERNHLDINDIDWLAPHQANRRIIDATADRIGISKNKIMTNIDRYGNTTAGTIPLLLWDYEKKIKKGDNLIITTFGGGFAWGSMWVKWSYDL